MPANTSSDERNEYSYPSYKDPLSARVISALAIFHIIFGILVLAIGIYITIALRHPTSEINAYNVRTLFGITSIVHFVLIAIGSFIFAAILFVVSNIACDIHRTNYNMHILLRCNQKNQKELVKNLQYIDDSITRQCGVIIHQINKKAPAQERPRQQESNAHDGAF